MEVLTRGDRVKRHAELLQDWSLWMSGPFGAYFRMALGNLFDEARTSLMAQSSPDEILRLQGRIHAIRDVLMLDSAVLSDLQKAIDKEAEDAGDQTESDWDGPEDGDSGTRDGRQAPSVRDLSARKRDGY